MPVLLKKILLYIVHCIGIAFCYEVAILLFGFTAPSFLKVLLGAAILKAAMLLLFNNNCDSNQSS